MNETDRPKVVGFGVKRGRLRRLTKWEAFEMVVAHHEECDDPDCRGMITQGKKVAEAWTRRGLAKAMAIYTVGKVREHIAETARLANERLGG